MVENQNIEWKESWRDEYLKWICGFANAQGGKIYIGFNDAGEIVGIDDSKKLMEDIPNKITQSLGIVANVNLHKRDGKDYIEIEIPAYSTCISYKGVYHYRSGSTKQVLTGPALESFLNGKRGVTWDNMPNPAFKLNDIDDSAFEKFKELAAKKGRIDASLLNETKEVLLEKLHLITNGYLNNAAMMLFAKDPEKWQVGAYVKVGYFESDAELIYQDEVRGSLIEIVDKLIELIYFKYMRAKITYVGIQRRERYFVPEEALRETLLNALCHSQYNYGVPVQISVYEDKMYIINCGQLPTNWTVENLFAKHGSRPYNPNIANVFYLAGFIESWGRGIEKICDACKLDNLPTPEFTINPGDIMVKFTAPEDRIVHGPGWVGNGVGDKVGNRVGDKVGDKVGNKVGNRVGDKVDIGKSDIKEAILELLNIDPGMTYKSMSKELSVSEKTVYKCMKQMRDNDVIVRIGNNKKGYWKIK